MSTISDCAGIENDCFHKKQSSIYKRFHSKCPFRTARPDFPFSLYKHPSGVVK